MMKRNMCPGETSSSLAEIQATRDLLHGLEVAAAELAAHKAISENLDMRRQAVAKDLARLDELAGTRQTVEQAVCARSRDIEQAQEAIRTGRGQYDGVLPEYEKAMNLLRAAREEAAGFAAALMAWNGHGQGRF